MGKRPPSKPRKFRREGREHFYAQYWADRLNDQGETIGRRQIHVTLMDEQGCRITAARKADRACDELYGRLLADWRGDTQDASLLRDYMDSYVSSALRRPGTSRSYGTKLGQFITFLEGECGVRRFSEVRREHVKQYLDARLGEVKLVTVHGDMRAIRGFFNEAVRDRKLRESPCRAVQLPRLLGAQVSEGFFLPQEMNQIVEYGEKHEPEWLPVLAGFRYAPFRREELCFLEWSDVDLERDHLHIRDVKPQYDWRPKRQGRIMDLHPRLKQIVSEMPREGGFVFAHPGSSKYADVIAERRELGRRAWRKLKTICDSLGLAEQDETGSWGRRFPKGPHLKAFRSGIACELQLNGAPLAYVQNQLGHHDSAITLEHYTHLIPDLMGHLTKRFVATLGT